KLVSKIFAARLPGKVLNSYPNRFFAFRKQLAAEGSQSQSSGLEIAQVGKEKAVVSGRHVRLPGLFLWLGAL
ncbi:hypothetical protein ABTD95_19870, partial [Acinetobacter baumannii]